MDRESGDKSPQSKVKKCLGGLSGSMHGSECDYDVCVEMLTLQGASDVQGGVLYFRGESFQNHYAFTIGNFHGTAMDLTKMKDGR